jgi:uncharacterized protein
MDQSQTLQMNQYLTKFVPGVSFKSASAVIELQSEGATVPFIARYRKEKTGNLDEVQIRAVIDAHETFNEIVKRKAFLLKEIADQGNLTQEIKKRIELSWDLGDLEEIYRPFKKKKKTKATLAREAGLEPLANWIWDIGHKLVNDSETMEVKAKNFLNPAMKINTYDEALKGAQDILVEKVANDPDLRKKVTSHYFEKAKVIAKASKGYKPHSKYEMYKEYEEDIKNLFEEKSSHRYMAMRRGWQEEELSLDIKGDDEALLKDFIIFATSIPDQPIGDFLAQCAKMALNVYVIPSVTNEVHRALKEKSDEHAIKVFAENVRRLLLGSPYGSRCVLGVDPGLRTGCKVALVDKSGSYISHTVMHILGEGAESKAQTLLGEVTKQIKIEAIAVGNGTAGRETEVFIRKILKNLGKDKEIPVIMVNESGASVYSASETARAEFPDLDVTVKGAISIARRLQDPLAELVKIDPKSIGVGQYQHDVSQPSLKKGLEAVVESCVNTVGVDVNTASTSLLAYVSGIGPALAQNIVEHRKKNGLFLERNDLLKVPKFTAKVFEQAAGFLRILNGKIVLDGTGIHPERYQAVRDMAQDIGASISELVGEGAKKLSAHREKWGKLVGEYTFDDIVKELEKPGRDPRDPFKVFQFRDDIFEVKDLKEAMICPGIVTNVTNFGAFVDIGVHQDGLVHISELAHKFVDDPRKVVNPGDQVKVKVLKVDIERSQISLTMKLDAAPVVEGYSDRPQQGNRQPREFRSGAHAASNSLEHKKNFNKSEKKDFQKRDSAFPQGSGSAHKPGAQNQGRPMQPANKNGHSRPQSGAGSQSSRGGSPFNNPFASLMNINKK